MVTICVAIVGGVVVGLYNCLRWSAELQCLLIPIAHGNRTNRGLARRLTFRNGTTVDSNDSKCPSNIYVSAKERTAQLMRCSTEKDHAASSARALPPDPVTTDLIRLLKLTT